MAGSGAGLRAYVRGTWVLLGVQLVLALGLGALSFWASQSLTRARAETRELQQQAQTAKAEVETARKTLEQRTRQYAEAAPLIQLGVKAVAGKQPQDARRFFAQAVSINPQDPFTNALLAQTIFESFDPREAVDAYAKTAALGPLEPADTVRYVQALCRIGKTEDALAEARKAFTAAPSKLLYEMTQQNAVRRCPALKAVVQGGEATAQADMAQSWAVTRVFLQISREEDRPRAQALQAALEAAKFDVPGIEFVEPARYPKTGEIRFYYKEQKEIADTLAKQVMQIGAASATDDVAKAWFAVALPTRGLVNRATGAPLYPGAPTDQVELWLPPQPAAPPIAGVPKAAPAAAPAP